MRLAAGLLLVVISGCTPASPPASDPSPSPTAAAADTILQGGWPDSLARAHDLVDSLELQALGNEPFWSVEITRQAIVYRDPEHLDGIAFPYEPPVGRAVGMVFESSRSDSGPRTIRIALEQRECSDGMSDVRYRYASQVRLDSLLLQGCARFRPRRPS